MKEKTRRSIDSNSCLFSKVIKSNPSEVWTLHLCITIFKPFKNTSDPRCLSSLRGSSNAKAVAYILPTAQARPNNKARTDVEASPCIFFPWIIEVCSFSPASRWHQCAAIDEVWITIQANSLSIHTFTGWNFLHPYNSDLSSSVSSAHTNPAIHTRAGNTLPHQEHECTPAHA